MSESRVADALAAFGPSLVKEGSKFWLNQFPDDVMSLVSGDLGMSCG